MEPFDLVRHKCHDPQTNKRVSFLEAEPVAGGFSRDRTKTRETPRDIRSIEYLDPPKTFSVTYWRDEEGKRTITRSDVEVLCRIVGFVDPQNGATNWVMHAIPEEPVDDALEAIEGGHCHWRKVEA